MKIPRFRLWLAAGVTTVVGVAGTVGAVNAPAANAAAGCRVDYTVTNQWPGGFGASVNITNLGDPINGWKLTWSFSAGQTITQLWSGSHTQSGSQVTVSNVDYNGSLPTGGSANFGFNGASTGSNPAPTSFALNGVTCTGGVTSSPSPSTSPSTGPSPSVTPTSTPTSPGTCNLPTSYR
ncbi:cellulose-binding domain-containing protein, partial [Streptosporangium sp. NPDC048047]|uniref:cellulose-binding domain-containing protein n=1 Tax=Streptosporangium sp. NPDC048047 TaxID=3155748 RepID=UPI0034398ED2